MKKLYSTILLAFAIALSLVVVPSASANTAAAGGSLNGEYRLCAPSQPNCFVGLDYMQMSCVLNDDSGNQNVVIGLMTGDNVNQQLYQIGLIRHWSYCGTQDSSRPSGLAVGSGYCLRWQEYRPIIHFSTDVYHPYLWITVLGVMVGQGIVYGRDLYKNTLWLTRDPMHNYSVAAWPC